MIHHSERIATGISLPDEVTTTVTTPTTFIRATLNPPPVLIGPREIEQMRRRKQYIADLRQWMATHAADGTLLGCTNPTVESGVYCA